MKTAATKARFPDFIVFFVSSFEFQISMLELDKVTKVPIKDQVAGLRIRKWTNSLARITWSRKKNVGFWPP